MNYHELFTEFTKEFNVQKNHLLRGIGIEAEIPVVTESGEGIGLPVVQNMFFYLEERGFQLQRDDFSDYIISATRTNEESAKSFDFHIDTVTTDAGYGIIEIAFAPQKDLHLIQSSFSEIMTLLVGYFDRQNCRMLGYGIQPLTAPSQKLLMPKERYYFYKNFSYNNVVPKIDGVDAHLLTITASNQCHIDVSSEEAIGATNVLNALSGLQIAFHANSPIWRQKVDETYKANREIFWEYCYPDRLNQMGIPPKFESIEEYVQYLLQFKPMLVKRNKGLLQILNKETFKDFMEDKTPTIGKTLGGDEVSVHPQTEDIHYLNTFCYFNARLVPRYGTIESRMCCQQPPNETLAPTALTLGILENLEEAQKLVELFPLETWRDIRRSAVRYTFDSMVNNESIVPILKQLLEIAVEGLKKRNLGEELFLEPLYERLKRRKSPADDAIAIFEKDGIGGLLEKYSFRSEDFSVTDNHLFEADTQTQTLAI
ncbi:MAG: glutamate-cysteine ligase family protein [Chitinophagales bacterium]